MNAIDVSIIYNASDRKWELRNGTIVSQFPAGKVGKEKAQDLYLQTVSPEIYALFLKVNAKHIDNPDFLRRLRKAAFLASRQQVLKPYATLDGEVARVASLTVPIEYRIRLHPENPDNLTYSCDCQDWLNALTRLDLTPDSPRYPPFAAAHLPHVGIFCKHVLAFILVERSGNTLGTFSPTSSELGQKLWEKTIEGLQHLTPEHLKLIENTQVVKMGRGNLYVSTPNHNILQWLTKDYRIRVEEELDKHAPFPMSLIVQGE